MHIIPKATMQFALAAIPVASAAICPNANAQEAAPAIPPATAHSAEHAYQIRMEYDRLRIPYPIIHLSINGHKPLPFIMDTGTNMPLTVMPWAARVLDLKPTGKKLGAQYGKMALMDVKRLECVLWKEEEGRFNILTGGKVDTVVYDIPYLDEMTATDRIAGIVGVNMWQAFTISFDFQAQSMTVMVGSHPPPANRDVVALPLKEEGHGRYYVPVQDLNGQPVDFMLDTGTPVTEMPQKDVARFGARTTGSVIRAAFIGVAPFEETLAVLDTLPLGSATNSQVELSVAPSRYSSVEAVLGMNVLSRYRVTIDFPAKKLYLKPAASSENQTRLSGLHVIRAKKHGPHILVDAVDAGSAAYRAGLRDHDRLLAVDSAPVVGLPVSVVQDMVDGLSGTDAHLRGERSGQIHEIVYHRYSLADDIVTAHLGMETSVADDFQMFIESVKRGSSAQKAGLHKGDTIISIGGFEVKITDDERLQSLLNNPQTNPLVLTVKRKGADHSEEIRLAW